MHLLLIYSKLDSTSNNGHKLLMAAKKSKRHPTSDDPDPQKRARRLREQEINRLVARYEELLNMRTVALEFRMSRETVAKHLAARGIDTSKSMKPADIKRAKELYETGMSFTKIGKRLGWDPKTIAKELRLREVVE